MPTLDPLDRRMLQVLTEEPRISVLELARRLQVARGTVQARLDRLQREGVIASWAPRLSAERMGYPVMAFVTLEIRQEQGHAAVVEHLLRLPQVLEAHTTTGAGDLLCRVVARSNAQLQELMDEICSCPGVRRTSTSIALSTLIEADASRLVVEEQAGC